MTTATADATIESTTVESTTALVTDVPIDDTERARRIRVAVRARSAELRERHPILRHQSALGAGILAAAALGVVGTAFAYATGTIAWWAAVPLSAIAMSLAHEVEHDTIHRLYFTRNKRARNVLFAVGWLLRPYTISPWQRRKLHLLHHEASGTELDFEEMGITNGQHWNLRRLVSMIDPLAGLLLHLPADPNTRAMTKRFIRKAWFPLTYLALGIWYSFLALGLANVVSGGAVAGSGIAGGVLGLVQFLAVVWIGPNVLRVTGLHFISSNMHYFGDVEPGNLIQQTQVLNRWWLAPAQIVCFNFGSTHAIHHFVPNDPFYVRQMTVKVAHRVMRDNGVRFNDIGTFRRANRYAAT